MRKTLYALCAVITLMSCARMGSPDGGWYDDTPPRVIGATPADKGTNINSRHINIYFDEFIKMPRTRSSSRRHRLSSPRLRMADTASPSN